MSTRLNNRTADSAECSTPEYDNSCRIPVVLLWAGATLWLVVAIAFRVLASVKLHEPNFLADTAWVSYGRIEAVASFMQTYGFALQASLGTALWILCRSGRTQLFEGRIVSLASVFWNGGVILGGISILLGNSTGFEGFEMPTTAASILGVCWLVIAGCGLITFVARNESEDFPSQWFIACSLIWFLGVYITAYVLLFLVPARGILQSAIASWYSQNLSQIVLGFVGLGSVFYLLPKLLERPLHTRQIAFFVLFTLALTASGANLHINAPFPAWMVNASCVLGILTCIPLTAVGLIAWKTADRDFRSLDSNISLRCSFAALIFWMVAMAQAIVSTVPSLSALVSFTVFVAAQKRLFLEGFFALAMFALIYHATPQLLRKPWPYRRLIQVHFWLFVTGVFLSHLVLLIGGVNQGTLLADPKTAFAIVMNALLPPLRFDTVGLVLVLLSIFAFAANFFTILGASLRNSAARLNVELLSKESGS